MTNQKLNIDNIAGIEEISDTDAANFNGGADIELFFDADFPEGAASPTYVGFNSSDNALVNTPSSFVNINNQTSSIRINEGLWRIYNGRDFTGNSVQVGFSDGTSDGAAPIEVNQSFLELVNLNDNISSIERVL